MFIFFMRAKVRRCGINSFSTIAVSNFSYLFFHQASMLCGSCDFNFENTIWKLKFQSTKWLFHFSVKIRWNKWKMRSISTQKNQHHEKFQVVMVYLLMRRGEILLCMCNVHASVTHKSPPPQFIYFDFSFFWRLWVRFDRIFHWF